jgi:hypothetical protein
MCFASEWKKNWSTANAALEDDQTELFIATTKGRKRRKELREEGPPRGPIPDSAGPKELMKRKLRTKRGRDIYQKRGQSVEPVFGKHVVRSIKCVPFARYTAQSCRFTSDRKKTAWAAAQGFASQSPPVPPVCKLPGKQHRTEARSNPLETLAKRVVP